MTDCSVFVTQAQFQQHLFEYELLIERINGLSVRLDAMQLRLETIETKITNIEDRLNEHTKELICGDNAHGGLKQVNIVVELNEHQLTVYLNICNKIFSDSISLKDLFMNVEVKIDEIKINQELIISLIQELTLEINNSETNNSINEIKIEQEVITNIVTSLEFFVSNQIFNTVNNINVNQNTILNTITTINENYVTSIQVNSNNTNILSSINEIKINQKFIENLISNINLDEQTLINIEANIRQVSRNYSYTLALIQNILSSINNVNSLILNNASQTDLILLINQIKASVEIIIGSVSEIKRDVEPLNSLDDTYRTWDCELEQEIIYPINTFKNALYQLNSQLYDIQNKICGIETDCGQLLPTDLAVWQNAGYYLHFFWKWENKDIKTGINVTQLPSPIEELINPTNIDSIWDQYFSNIHRIVGIQLSQLFADNIANAIYTGWFLDRQEASRFFDIIKNFTSLPLKPFNNPTFPDYGNKKANISNTGEKLLLRKVCVIEKARYSDEITHILTYVPPK